ncbi:MAG: aminoglycoside phosphotransferase family protein [Patescibacteria group bacterium]|jgi:hypothetical protein
MLIPEIDKKISGLLAEKQLVPGLAPDQYLSDAEISGKKFFKTICDGKDGKRYFFKALVFEGDNRSQPFKKEIGLNQQLGEISFRSFVVPKIVDCETGDFSWYLREYVEGDVVGDVHLILDNQANLRDRCINAINVIFELDSFRAPLSLKEISPFYYLKPMEECAARLHKYIPNFLSRVSEIISGPTKYLMAGEGLVHGDFHFGNIVFADKAVLVTDWESAHLGSCVEDFVHIWATSWRYPEAQTLLAERFKAGLSTSASDQLVQTLLPMLVYQISRELQHWTYSMENPEKNPYEMSVVKEGFNYFYQMLTRLLDLKNQTLNLDEIGVALAGEPR